MSLTILSVAYPFAPVGPDAVGGAEQILSHLDRALAARGDRSIVVACEGSTTAGELVATRLPKLTLTDSVRQRVREEHLRNIEAALGRYDVDLIHMHGIDFAEYLPPEGWPVLVTLHLPPGWYSQRAFAISRSRTFMVCVSESQRRACPDAPGLLGVIENGVSEELLDTARNKGDFTIALGRICPEKNFHVAMDAAKRAGISMILGGKVFPYEEHQRYFEREIAPRLDDRVRFAGEIGFERKKELLASARCLLMPSIAPETSSLVAMEAMACGTPVIAFPSGALPEVIEDGVTGFLVNDQEEMAAAIGRLDRIDPQACRKRVRERFTAGKMVERYLEAYQEVLGGSIECSTTRIQLRTEQITELADLQALAPEWKRLVQDDKHATVFQRPQWLIPWWKHIGEGELWAISARQGDKPVGLMPLYVYQRPEGGTRELFFLGMGTSDYLGSVSAADCEKQAAQAMFEVIQENADRWDVCEFTQLREGSPLLQAAGGEAEISQGEACPALGPPQISKPMSEKLHYYRRRAHRMGGIRFELADERCVATRFADLIRLHSMRWGQNGVLQDQRVREWHFEMLPQLAEAGLLRMWSMLVDGRVVAVHYGLADGRAWYYYLGGFDPAYQQISPGTLVLGHAIEEAQREGLATFDFLRGTESYKYLWGAVDQKTYRLRIVSARQGVQSAMAAEGEM